MDDVGLFELVHLHHLDQGFARSDFFHLVVFLLEGVNDLKTADVLTVKAGCQRSGVAGEEGLNAPACSTKVEDIPRPVGLIVYCSSRKECDYSFVLNPVLYLCQVWSSYPIFDKPQKLVNYFPQAYILAYSFIETQVVCLTAAMPPDVRQVSDLPGNAAQRFRAAPALRGIAPICWGGDSPKATGLPHIGRRSRNNLAVNFIA